MCNCFDRCQYVISENPLTPYKLSRRPTIALYLCDMQAAAFIELPKMQSRCFVCLLACAMLGAAAAVQTTQHYTEPNQQTVSTARPIFCTIFCENVCPVMHAFAKW